MFDGFATEMPLSAPIDQTFPRRLYYETIVCLTTFQYHVNRDSQDQIGASFNRRVGSPLILQGRTPSGS